MGKMAQLLHTIRTSLSTKKRVEMITRSNPPIFDKKYKIILKYDYTNRYIDMMDWVDKNSSGLVSTAVAEVTPDGVGEVYFAFENSDDALFFKIKYSI